MTGPWLPRFRTGGSSSETIDGRGLQGRYIQFDWLGFSLNIDFASVYANDRCMAALAAEKRREP